MEKIAARPLAACNGGGSACALINGGAGGVAAIGGDVVVAG